MKTLNKLMCHRKDKNLNGNFINRPTNLRKYHFPNKNLKVLVRMLCLFIGKNNFFYYKVFFKEKKRK